MLLLDEPLSNLDASLRVQVRRDLLSGRMVVDFPRWTGVTEMPDIATTFRSEGLSRYEITDGDPLSAVTTTRFRIRIERPGTSAEHQITENRF